ncbi:radical SAM/SPASM domain-containing protein [Aerosakkonema funiforme]|uniref:Radical SAM protein n=2 Tax=Oscillatoriophycideae TaxID=1301283 RepID=A0A926VJR6_9CYAN|nr:radical SAM protein [Aerosakkonema funiforme]MBD2185162.1 radical SAM protein [Aerosakkonema funiforme FACHB-1375]
MNPFLSNIRLKWFLATRALDYSADFVKILYQIYLNHNKIIHFRNGYPVYSLSTPALFSKPASNFIARALYRTIQNKNLPNLMSFAVNDICNATCEHCSFFEAVEEKNKNILTLQQAQKLIKDAQELGVSVINFVGGEPLLHQELPEIIKAVNKDFSTTILFTNGWHLEKRAAELKKAGLDSIYISIDAASPEKHDRFRKQTGLFDRAMRGIQTAKKLGFSVGISTTMTPESYRDGELDRIVKLGKKIGIHEVLVFDALPTGRYKERQDLVDNNDWIEEMIQSARKYNQNPNYPGVVFFAYFTSHRSVGCSCGTSYFYVSPYGDIMSCDFNHAKFGNILEEPLWKIWDRLTTLPEFCQAKWGGCKIKDSEFRQKETVSSGNLNIHI